MRHAAAVESEDHDGEERERARLVGGAQLDGNGVDEGEDSEGDLRRHGQEQQVGREAHLRRQ